MAGCSGGLQCPRLFSACRKLAEHPEKFRTGPRCYERWSMGLLLLQTYSTWWIPVKVSSGLDVWLCLRAALSLWVLVGMMFLEERICVVRRSGFVFLSVSLIGGRGCFCRLGLGC
jgi:hypothetical protein